MPEIPPPPPGSRVTLRQGPEGLVFHFPRTGFLRAGVGPPGAVFLLSIFYGGLFFGMLALKGPDLDLLPLGCSLSPFVLILVVTLAQWIANAQEEAECIVVPGGLRIVYRKYFYPRFLEWHRSEIEAVGVWSGLWIGAAGRKTCLLSKWNGAGLIWAGHVIRCVLNVPESVAPKPGELAVSFNAPGYPQQSPGILQVSPGRMTLRHGFAAFPPYHFRRLSGSSVFPVPFVKPGRTLKVIPQDLSCRQGDPKGSVLQIEPTGSRRIFTMWCEEAEGLPRAVARFWGGKDEDNLAGGQG